MSPSLSNKSNVLERVESAWERSVLTVATGQHGTLPQVLIFYLGHGDIELAP
jgi:hypothetical protein